MLFDSEFLRRIQYLSLVARQARGRSLLAAPRKRLPAGGTEVTGLRDYSPGDEYRHVDWTWCARRDELLTKVFAGQLDLHAYILLDCSPSMGLGEPSKFQLARQIAAVLACAALGNLDCVSVAAFSGGIVAGLPPLRGRAQLPRLLRFLEQLPLQGTQTNLARATEVFSRRYQRHGPVVLLSDLYDPAGFRPGLDMLLHRGYEPRVVQIHEPREAEPGLLGDVELCDVESAAVRQVTITERAAACYRKMFAEFRQSVRGYCAQRGIACLQLASSTPEDEVVLQVLGARGEGLGARGEG